MPSQCKKTRQNGDRCKAYTIYASHFCFWHSPRMRKKRDEARKRGGLNRRKDNNKDAIKYELKTYNDIQRLLEKEVNDLLKGNTTTRKVRTVVYLCNLAKAIRNQAECEREDIDIDLTVKEAIEKTVALQQINKH